MEKQVTTEGKISAPIITMAEASLISGISESDVMALLKQGAIKGKQYGTNWRIYRMSLLAHLNREKEPVAQTEETRTSESRVGASVAGTDDALSDELWATRKALEQERDGHAFERTLHEATKAQLAAALADLNAMRQENANLRDQLAAATTPVVPQRSGFFGMLRRIFSW